MILMILGFMILIILGFYDLGFKCFGFLVFTF